MLASALTRLRVGRIAPDLFVKGALTRCFLHQSLQQNVRALATEAIPTEPKPPRKLRTASTTKKAASPKKLVKKKAAKKVVPKKVKKPKKVVVKAKSWEARDVDGKLLPLPSATKPKRTSSFLLYVQSRMPTLLKDPSMQKEGSTDKVDVTKAITAIGAEWKALSEADKGPFKKQYESAKATYETKMTEWRNSLSTEDIRRQNAYHRAQVKKGKKPGPGLIRDPSRPKTPMSSFFLFLQDYRLRNEGNLIEIAKQAGVEWKSMSPEKKKPYLDKSEENKASYASAIKDYESNLS